MAAILTTVDNPHDPVKEFDEWYSLDRQLAREHNVPDSCSLLGRLAITSPRLSDELNAKIIEDTIDEIVELDPEQRYRKVIV